MTILEFVGQYTYLAAVIFLMFRSVRLITVRRDMTSVFFTFGVASLLFSEFYWIAYEFIRPDTRMPFAANEFGEWAMMLLMAETLTTLMSGSPKPPAIYFVCSVLFAAANTALWIGWTGEWLQDILTGIIMCYYLYRVIHMLYTSGAFAKYDWTAAGIGSVVLLSLQAVIFFVPESFVPPLDLTCYVLAFSGDCYFLFRTFTAFRKKAHPDICVALSFAAEIWAEFMLYMSSGAFYGAALIICAVCLILKLRSISMEDGKRDLR
ncbi:MAG: hypothetical protein IJS94_01350 [Clostridia bacterium]|nr:hypothetical protein [Clostridia bacterium]